MEPTALGGWKKKYCTQIFLVFHIFIKRLQRSIFISICGCSETFAGIYFHIGPGFMGE